MKKGLLLIIICSILFSVNGQDNKPVRKKVYKLNYKIEIPVTVGLYAINYYGFGVLRRKPTLSIDEINALNKDDVWAFDRRALEQSYSDSKRETALTASDWGMNVSLILPVFLFLDKKIRKDWLDITLLYLETQAINSNLYTWTGPMLTDRIRPLVYYDEVDMEEKTGSGTTSSFFSGHTSWTAGASFFMAKVISDYHPELGGKKWLVFAAALIPPAFVGYNRYKGLKHFPTDIIFGTAVGAAAGILTPHLHKNKKDRKVSMSLVPYSGKYSGLAFKMAF